jgi:hypothetical protein
MVGLGDRVHMFAQPNARDAVILFFRDTLGCGEPMTFAESGMTADIVAFVFANGASVSVEFTEEAPDGGEVSRGAWLELVTDEPLELEKRIREAGLPQVDYLDNAYFYFRAPGGQVMRVVGIADS